MPSFKRIGDVALLFCAIGVAVSLWFYPSTPVRVLAAGTPAPTFQAVTLEGASVRLQDFQGRPVLLMVYALDCAPSARALAALPALQAARPDVVVLVVNGPAVAVSALRTFWHTQERASAPTPFLRLVDPLGDIARLYHLPAVYPAWVFIEATGQVAAVRFGEHAGLNLQLRVKELLPRGK